MESTSVIMRIAQAYEDEHAALAVYISEEGNFKYTFGVMVAGLIATGVAEAVNHLVSIVEKRIGRRLDDDADLGFAWLTREEVQELRGDNDANFINS